MRRSAKVSFMLLIVLISLGGLALFAYNSGFLQQWSGKSNSPPAPLAAPVVVEPGPKPLANEGPENFRPNNIFDLPGSSAPKTPGATVPRPTATPPASANVGTPAAIQPPKPSVRDARARLNSAMAAVEQSLAKDPAYMQARSDAGAADARRKSAAISYGAGSSEVLAAGQQWLDAKSKLQKMIASAAARDPAAIAAQHELSEAEANARLGKR